MFEKQDFLSFVKWTSSKLVKLKLILFNFSALLALSRAM